MLFKKIILNFIPLLKLFLLYFKIFWNKKIMLHLLSLTCKRIWRLSGKKYYFVEIICLEFLSFSFPFASRCLKDRCWCFHSNIKRSGQAEQGLSNFDHYTNGIHFLSSIHESPGNGNCYRMHSYRWRGTRSYITSTLNDRHGVSNYQPIQCLFSSLFILMLRVRPYQLRQHGHNTNHGWVVVKFYFKPSGTAL